MDRFALNDLRRQLDHLCEHIDEAIALRERLYNTCDAAEIKVIAKETRALIKKIKEE